MGKRPVVKAGRCALNLAMFVLGFAVVARVLAPAGSTDPGLQAKLEHFRRHMDDYDLVFFGSSRIHRAFDPRVFGRVLAARGREIRAVNFGVGAMRPHELNAVLRRLLAMRPARLRWVLIELMDWEPTILENMTRHPRTTDWHDLSETWSACRTVWLADLSDKEQPHRERLARWRTHLSQLAVKQTNWGQGPRRIQEWLGRNRPQSRLQQLIARGDGFVAIDDETGPRYRFRRREFLTKYFDTFHRQIRDLPAEQKMPATLAHFNVAATLQQQAAIRAAGAEPIYVVPNLRWGTPVLHRLARDGVISNFIALNDPLSLPALYTAEHYFDQGHLNRRGAWLFSVELAGRFAARLKQQ